MNERSRNALCVVALLLLVGIFYGQTVGHDFVNWDDPWYVVQNPLIKSWSLTNLKGIATEVVTRNYAPVTIFSYLVDHTFYGLWAGGYHLTNVLLHGLNVVLVFVLLKRLTGSRSVALMTAALFAAHPIQIETVAWISSRKGLLSAAFMLSALICWLRPVRSERHDMLGLSFFALALLSKAIAVVLPAIVLAYDVYVQRKQIAESIARQFLPGVMAVCLLLITMSAQVTQIGGVRGHMGLSKLEILGIDTVLLWQYIGMLIRPGELCVLYDPPTSGIAGLITISTLAWGAVSVAVYRSRERYPLLAFAAICAVVLMVPVLNLFPLTTLMNDRYLYLPCIPVFAVAAVGLSKVLDWTLRPTVPGIDNTVSVPRAWLPTLVTAILVVLCHSKSSEYLPVWKNDQSLWEYTYTQAPQIPAVRIQYANSLHNDGRDPQACNVLKETLARYSPDDLDRQRIEQKLDAWQ
ncbi:MAG: hypothetical protein CMJ78_06590 [Planctomycetaceae bacterium]|nr:hypothetical protein [Planctomycetaceae bacterium]